MSTPSLQGRMERDAAAFNAAMDLRAERYGENLSPRNLEALLHSHALSSRCAPCLVTLCLLRVSRSTSALSQVNVVTSHPGSCRISSPERSTSSQSTSCTVAAMHVHHNREQTRYAISRRRCARSFSTGHGSRVSAFFFLLEILMDRPTSLEMHLSARFSIWPFPLLFTKSNVPIVTSLPPACLVSKWCLDFTKRVA